MAVSITKAGPYYASGAITFSSLRTNFRAQNIDGTYNSDSLSIKASELKRITNQAVSNPTVPDATENTNISTNLNLKLSQFRNSVKYYTLTQSGVDDNSGNNLIPGLNISSQSWNSNLNKNIRKKIIINGTVGSYYNTQPALYLSGDICNTTIGVTGGIYGAGGVSSFGGTAIYANNTLSLSLVSINLDSESSKIYGGGGGGGTGGSGSTGGTGGTAPSVSFTLAGGTGGTGGPGGAGGRGQGYDGAYATGSTGSGGSGGGVGNDLGKQFRYPQYSGVGNGIVSFSSGSGGTGGQGGTGGTGGNWGETGATGFVGNTGISGTPSSSAIFLKVDNFTSSISYTGQSNAGHTNNFIISGFETWQYGGEEGFNFSGTISAKNAGYYGPVESYDVTIGNNPNGIYINGTPANSLFADDNGAGGDDANDLMVFLDSQSGNVYLGYVAMQGESGTTGTSGLPGAAGGAAISGSNYSVSGTINNNTLKGSYNT